MPEALNLLDDRRPGQREAALALLDALESRIPRSGAKPSDAVHRDAPRIGLTGAPGSGKSTLLDALVRVLRDRHETIGIVAVDPSSRVSGGALLGDRARVRAGAGDRGVFLRSMAARERLGGLADATWPSVAVLAAVFDRVFVETVGVGQSEAEVAGLVDTLKNKTPVDFVGYGVQYQAKVPGSALPQPPPYYRWTGLRVRLYAPSELVSGRFVHSAEYLRLALNPGGGSGGTCFGDSGGPDLLGSTDTVLGVNSYVTNVNCGGVGYSSRVDIPEVLDWVEGFLDD